THISVRKVQEMTRMGLRAISLDSHTMRAAVDSGRNVYKEILQGAWQILVVSPERLGQPEFNKVIRSDAVQSRLALVAVDEAHVVVPWSKDFREDYKKISSLFLRIKSDCPVLLLTATLTSVAQRKLMSLVGFQDRSYLTIRRPVVRPNVRLLFRTLRHGINPKDGKFPDIGWAAFSEEKAVIFCKTASLGLDVASYLWRLTLAGEAERKRRIRLYNGTTEDGRTDTTTLADFVNDPDFKVIIATIKFGMGVDILRDVRISVNFGLPDTAETLFQQLHRAGRNPGRSAVGITYIEQSHATVAANLEDSDMVELAEMQEVSVSQRKQPETLTRRTKNSLRDLGNLLWRELQLRTTLVRSRKGCFETTDEAFAQS
ncbi:P-loop containing nucleoside triphosphate hydrolase protein, partial [Gloeopeniophorella convolvens]